MLKKTGVIILLTLSCVIVYGNMLNNRFVWDDKLFIEKSYFIRDFSNIKKVFYTDYWQASYRAYQASFYRPLITASFIIDFRMWKNNPFGYHLTNLIFHILTCFIFFAVIRYFMSLGGAVLGSLVFAVHPIHTESVTFICGRTDVMSAFFLFTSLYLFIRGIFARKSIVRIFLISAVALLYMLALLCKEASIVGLALFGVTWLCFRQDSRAEWRYPVQVLLAVSAMTVLYMIIRYTLLSGVMAHRNAYPGATFMYTVLTLPKIIVLYIGKLLVPVGLSIDYAPRVVTSVLSASFIFPIIIILILLSITIVSYKRGRKVVAYGILWFFITVLPVTNIIPIGIFMADRFLYIPSLGLAFVGGYILDGLVNRNYNRRIVFGCIIVIMLSSMVLVVRRNTDWRNEYVLWSKTAETTPASFRAQGSLGQIFMEQGRYDEALRRTRLALLYNPDDYRVLGNLGVIYLSLHKYDKAIESFKKVLRLEPRDFRTYANLYVIYAEQNKPALALECISKAIQNSPRNIELRRMKASYLYNLKQYGKAVMEYMDILKIMPDDIESLVAIGDIFRLNLNDAGRAEEFYTRALTLDPSNNDVIGKLSKINK